MLQPAAARGREVAPGCKKAGWKAGSALVPGLVCGQVRDMGRPRHWTERRAVPGCTWLELHRMPLASGPCAMKEAPAYRRGFVFTSGPTCRSQQSRLCFSRRSQAVTSSLISPGGRSRHTFHQSSGLYLAMIGAAWVNT